MFVIALVGANPAVATAELTAEEAALSIDAYRAQRLSNVRASVRTRRPAVVSRAEEIVAAKPTTTAPPDGFADRVQSTLSDFLPLFQGAVNTISTSEDKRTVTLRLNPLRTGARGQFAVIGVVTQPELFDAIEDQIVEAVRETQAKELIDGVDDFADIALGINYGYQRRAGSWKNPNLPSMWGRNIELYRGLIDELFEEGVISASAATDKAIRDIDTRMKPLEDDLVPPEGKEQGDMTMGWARQQLGTRFPEYEALLAEEAMIQAAFLDRLDPAQAIGSLIDNQPQLLVTGNYRARDPLIGPHAKTLTLAVEWGATNFNSVIREFRWQKKNEPQANPYDALVKVLESGGVRDENRFTLSATYVHQNRYSSRIDYIESVTDPDDGTSVKVPHTIALERRATDAVDAKLQWGRLLSSQATGDAQLPRLDIAVEYVSLTKGDPDRTKDRFVASGTLTVPMGAQATLPLTLTYANKPEFLGDQKRLLSAHVGLNYKFTRSVEDKRIE